MSRSCGFRAACGGLIAPSRRKGATLLSREPARAPRNDSPSTAYARIAVRFRGLGHGRGDSYALPGAGKSYVLGRRQLRSGAFRGDRPQGTPGAQSARTGRHPARGRHAREDGPLRAQRRRPRLVHDSPRRVGVDGPGRKTRGRSRRRERSRGAEDSRRRLCALRLRRGRGARGRLVHRGHGARRHGRARREAVRQDRVLRRAREDARQIPSRKKRLARHHPSHRRDRQLVRALPRRPRGPPRRRRRARLPHRTTLARPPRLPRAGSVRRSTPQPGNPRARGAPHGRPPLDRGRGLPSAGFHPAHREGPSRPVSSWLHGRGHGARAFSPHRSPALRSAPGDPRPGWLQGSGSAHKGLTNNRRTLDMQRNSIYLLAAAVAVTSLSLAGCATTTDVDKKIADAQSKTDKKIESVETQFEDMQEKQKVTEGKVGEQGKQIEQISQSAKEALQRAQEAGVLAKGKILFQQSFAEDRVRFKVNSFELTKDAKSALDEFAAKIKGLDKGVYLEIQGHTDDTGGADYNDQLGQQRAEAVRRYLAREHKLPLGRISTISYGDTQPVQANKTAKGRTQNRRVVIVVLE